jgi:hypothetical protein
MTVSLNGTRRALDPQDPSLIRWKMELMTESVPFAGKMEAFSKSLPTLSTKTRSKVFIWQNQYPISAAVQVSFVSVLA